MPEADHNKDRHDFAKPLVIVAVVGGTAAALLVAHRFGLWDWARATFSSVESMRGFVSGFGAWAPAVFFLAQVSQVVLAT